MAGNPPAETPEAQPAEIEPVARPPGTPPPIDVDIPEPGGGGPGTKEITIPERREWIRGLIAIILVAIFGLEVLGAMLVLWLCSTQLQQLKELLPLILSPTVAVVGSVLGFYFGGKEEPTAGTGRSPP